MITEYFEDEVENGKHNDESMDSTRPGCIEYIFTPVCTPVDDPEYVYQNTEENQIVQSDSLFEITPENVGESKNDEIEVRSTEISEY